jgi:hypothetical protein
LAGQAWLGARPVGSDEHYEANSAGVSAIWPGEPACGTVTVNREKAEKQKSEDRIGPSLFARPTSSAAGGLLA